ncbi:MAG TPA: enoyl-CoA hydratase-related protein [Saprospiraceae bacterium]|nr:enoyl-CoA hydratase-related protein [Saprospiraceae bacterium]
MSFILSKRIDSVLILSLNRPEVFNSFNRLMALELQEILDDAELDEEVRCIVITGIGKAFSAGQDLQEVTDPKGPSLPTILGEHYNPIIKRIRYIEKPIIAAVNGVAAGAGANIALACDVVLASSVSSFIQAFSKIGLIPDSGGTFFLPRLIGFQRASALSMLGDKISAVDAEKMGMVYKVIEENVFMDEVEKLAITLSQMPTIALGFIKKALNRSMFNDLESQLEVEEVLQTQAGQTYDYKEGVQAFIEKRKPVFKAK